MAGTVTLTAAIAFDLDGTLVDSAAGVAHALNTSLERAGLRRFDPPTIRGWIGDGPDTLIQRALAASRLRDVEPATLAARLRHDFDQLTLHDRAARGPAFPGIAELVDSLAGHYPLVVVTNKPTLLARAVLEGAGLLHAIAHVHGADDAAQRKPSPLLLQQAAARLGLPTHGLLMVGDGPADVGAAHAAGCAAAWVAWGYGEEPERFGPAVWRIEAPEQLLQRLRAPRASQREPIH